MGKPTKVIVMESAPRMARWRYQCEACGGIDFSIPSHCYTGLESKRTDGICCLACGLEIDWKKQTSKLPKGVTLWIEEV